MTISSRHRLLSDLYDRLGNLTPKIVRNRKDRKKIGELRDELTQQIARIKDQSFSEVPRKAQLVAEAIQMLHKYPVDVTTTVVAVTDEMVPNKVSILSSLIRLSFFDRFGAFLAAAR